MVMGSKPMWETSNKNKNLLTKHMEQIKLHIIVKSPIIVKPCKAPKKTSSKCAIWSSIGVFSISCEEENNERMKEMRQPWTLA
jgi:hypothetical protein